MVLRGKEADCKEVAAYARANGIEAFSPGNRYFGPSYTIPSHPNFYDGILHNLNFYDVIECLITFDDMISLELLVRISSIFSQQLSRIDKKKTLDQNLG